MGFHSSSPPSAAWSLVLLAVVSLATILPSFWILSYFHPFVIRIPGDDAFAVLIYIARLPFVIIGAIAIVTIYVDLVTPAVIGAWAIALRRYAEAVYGEPEDKDVSNSAGYKSFLDVSRDSCASPAPAGAA
ncbi:hypothetical protein QR680_016856 [Steinernema hermaphroditum]|uniref:Uncharacterized protein n=1 Tax=Steinernema hermaphroditum TaxID=289476 RepID=A0AA39HEH0_9BILA|nr:hypothetical protein QR680_016856 [Steinernema hermaphroditum]